jgi:SanA protein
MSKKPHLSPSHRWQWLAFLFLGGLLTGTIVLGWTLWTLKGRYRDRIYGRGNEGAIPAKPVAIVFGAGYWPNGVLSTILLERLDAAVGLYHEGRVEKLLFSGDNSRVDYNEPAKMLEYALSQGVPRSDIVLDYAGRRTYDTCYRAGAIFGVSHAVLVTQHYHLPRALTTCENLGLNAVGYGANRYRYRGRYLILYRLREIPALWRAWWDLYVMHPIPILGDPLPIFVDNEHQKHDA